MKEQEALKEKNWKELKGTSFVDEFSKEIYEQTYKYGDEDINGTFSRIAKDLSKEEKEKDFWANEFEWALEDFKFVPGGRIVSNAGTGLKGTTYINCFVDGFMDSDRDSMEGILSTLRRQALILKSEGGYGFCADTMRPRGGFVNGIGNESPGAVKMLEMWDTQSAVITAGSGRKTQKAKAKIKIRKGAQMVTMSCWHPDFEEFITAKQTPGRLTKFNMSSLITDEFMNAVENNLPWNLEFPDYDFNMKIYKKEWDGNLKAWKEKGYPTTIYKVYANANELWDLIMKSTYNRNEPGVLFVDTINRMNNLFYCEYISATNPCLDKNTWVFTKENGPIQIKNIVGKKVNVLLNGEFFETTEDGFFPTGKKDIFEIKLKNGLKIKSTDNHRFYSNCEWKEVKDLKIDDLLNLSQNDTNFDWIGLGGTKEEGWLIGSLIGDGHFSGEDNVNFSYWGSNKLEMHQLAKNMLKNTVESSKNNRNYFDNNNMPTINKDRDNVTLNTEKLNYLIKQFGLSSKNKEFNEKIEMGSSEFYSGVIGGFFDADGSVWGNNQTGINVSFSQSNLYSLECLQRMLLRIGIESKIFLSHPSGYKEMPDGKGGKKEYLTKDNYELRVTGRFMVKRFFDKIFVLDENKKQKFEFEEKSYTKNPYLRQEMFQSKIESITKISNDIVFDCTVPDVHAFDANGFVSHNCGEQVLPTGGVCLLGSLNLTQFIDFKNKDFDYEKLAQVIPIAVRLMDNVNDITYVPLESQTENLKGKRRIGLGIMGYGSALMMLKMRYGSNKALKITEKLNDFIANESYKASALLAKEKGAFPLYDAEKYLSGEFVKVLSPETLSLMKKYGVRNSHLLSIQPTGNSSIFANVVSGGLEPVFMPIYNRTSIMPYAPEGLSVPKFIDWDNKKYEVEGLTLWSWAKEGDENLLKTEFGGYTWKIDKSRGLLRETTVKDFAVRFLEEKGQWDFNADWAATTTQLNIDEHAKTMAVMSKYIDSAMSKTVNIPFEYPFEDFKKFYMDLFKTGTVKGGTTYRAGTMTEVLAAVDKKEDADGTPRIKKNDAPKRPKTLDCDIHTTSVAGDQWIVLVGLLEGEPYEVFAFKKKNISIPSKFKHGKLSKVKSGKYDLELEEIVFENIKDHFDTDEQEALTRMISAALRHGTDIKFIYEQLEKSEGTVVSFSKAVARTLKKYLKDGDFKAIESLEGCGSGGVGCNVVREDGCIKCLSCGLSKC